MPTLTSINPHNGETLATYETISNQEVEQKIQTAHKAYLAWKDMSFDYRRNLCYKLAAVMRDDQAALAELQTREM